MVFKMFSVYDDKAKAYLPPFVMHNAAMAQRAFSDGINGESNFATHPEDYNLFYLGEWDDSSGYFVCLPAPTLVVQGVQVAGASHDTQISLLGVEGNA